MSKTRKFIEIVSLIKNLSENEKQELASILLSRTSYQFHKLNETSERFSEERFANGLFCPHCGVTHEIVKYGKTRQGEQRYLCRTCHKTFISKTNTVFSGSHKTLDVWKVYLDCMVNQYSIRKTAEICHINTHTAFVWRHKILDALSAYKEEDKLKGVVEADETFFRVSYKGSRKLPRPAKRRGTGSKRSGLSREQVCVVCAVDRNGNRFSQVTSLGCITTNILHDILDERIIRGSILCTDGFRTYQAYADDNFGYIRHIIIDSVSRKNGIYHINHVNAYHSFMKLFIIKFRGVSTKYLQNYLEWYNTIYGILGEKAKRDNLVKPVMRVDFNEKWDDVDERPALPLLAA